MDGNLPRLNARLIGPALALALVAACGGSVGVQSEAGASPDAVATGDSAADAECGNPEVCCGLSNGNTGCEIAVATAVCSNGGWTCPAGSTPSDGCSRVCVGTNDGGADAAADSGDATVSVDAGDATTKADGEDGSTRDGASSHLFACGEAGLTCDDATQYCYIVEGGPPPLDGGTDEFPSCDTIPAACVGAALSCTCIQQQTGSSGDACSDADGDVTVTLAVP
jgi:hypothetical protein